jgi:hypothetical protein
MFFISIAYVGAFFFAIADGVLLYARVCLLYA